MRWRRRRHIDTEVAPEDIFLDASNEPEFDRARFEGRIEQPLSRGTFLTLSIVLSAIFILLGAQTVNLQIVQGEAYSAQSASNSLEVRTLFAPRGIITDRNGVVLAENVPRDGGVMGRQYAMPAIGQIIGYVSNPKKDSKGNYYDTSQSGVAGLEAEYDTLLTGQNGQILTETDALGRVRSEGGVIPAKEGQTLRLSIDVNVEKHFASAIAKTAREQGFIAGAGAIMDVQTGEVLAIVSYPSYDPNVMANGNPRETIAGYNTDAGYPFLDHAVQGVYVPGSIVKPFIALGALTDGLITSHTVINDPGQLLIDDPYNPGKTYVYKGWRALGDVDVERAIAWSSDVFFYTIGGGFKSQKGLGIDRLNYWYRAFGMGTTTGIDLPAEAQGRIPTPEWKKATFKEQWYLGDTYFTSIGQYAVQVTPIQMARAAGVLANGGKLLTPTLRTGQTPVSSDVPIDQESLGHVRTGMRQAVTSALASMLNVSYVSVAAKTGTAQTGTRNQYDNSWIVGYFPYNEPKYSFAVVLERGPGGAGEQSVNAMRRFFDLLYLDHSPYVGGNGVPPIVAATTTPT